MKKRILIVDDDYDAVEVIAYRLKSHGYEILKAHDGKEAIEKSRRERPDLIILDFVLPELNGAEVEMALSKDVVTREIPIIFLTGIAEHGSIETSPENVTRPMIEKTLYDEDNRLIKTIEELISR